MSSDKLDRTFPIIDSATGDNIGEGTLHPNGTEGGKISVVFNEQANNRSNLSGNVYLWVPFNKNHIELNQKNVFTFTIKGNGIYNGYQMSAETTITRPSTSGEVIAKWGEGLPAEPNTVKWIIRINKNGMDLHHVVLSDSLVTDNGWFLHPVDISKERFKLQKVTYTENAGISNWGEVIDVTDKIQFAPDYKSWTLDLGDIGTQGYMLFMKTAMTSGTLQKNKVSISSDKVTKDVTAQYKLADVGGNTGVTTVGKLKVVKQDAETGTGLAGAKFEIKNLDDNSIQTLVTGADGEAVTPNVVFEASYEVREIEAPFGYKIDNTVYTIQTSVSKDNVVTVKDQPITRDIKVNKTWVGNTGTQAVMHLYADNVDTGKSATLDATNNWEYTFAGLRKYNGTQEIQYSIKEDEMNFYMTSVTGNMDNGFNVTNTWNEQHELPGDAPTVEIPEFKITTFVNTDNEPIADFENGFTDKKDEITFNNVKYVFKEKLPDENGIRTHVYKKHINEEVPNDNTTKPTENNTSTENNVIESTAPTGDGMMNTLKLFALSVLGLGVALTKRKGLRDE